VTNNTACCGTSSTLRPCPQLSQWRIGSSVHVELREAGCRSAPIEIIGEASSRLAPETQALFPGLPFRQMRGMRNIIAHDYGDVDLDQVWRTASGSDLTTLITVLQSFFESAEGACEI
jgi:uncharacterized protein with HEPN domain